MAAYHPDGPLVLRLRGGDVDALGDLYAKYKTNIYRTALAITRDPGAAEDILQETFSRLCNRAGRIRTDVSVLPWLYRVAVNLSYSWVQRQKRRAGVLEGLLDRLVTSLQLLPDQVVEEKEAQEAVQEAILGLPMSHRIVVVLHYLEGLGLAEIAEILQIPEGTVKSRLHYARHALRKALDGHLPVSGVVYEFT